ncbi:MAG: hypothetical protein A3F78_08335 [Burkholderiales bacterium RIFCSPLOWO2_12_FULL_61_40]|nr:MAG: hypothetical protein A3F78_08335 [Burkholderiales bacterium RIFCSPLOWO2_12_FULL_61_40]
MQTITAYKMNPASAKLIGVSDFITEKGAYTGVFTRAEIVRSPKGTQGVEFDFRSSEGQHARYLTVWTVNSDGKELHGRKILDAIMTCIGVRSIEASTIKFPKWDAQAGAEVQTHGEGFASLMNVPVGVVLVREQYLALDQTPKWKNVIVCPFEAATGRLAGERLENRSAENLKKMVALLKDRTLSADSGRSTNKGSRRPADTHDDNGHRYSVPDEVDF